MSEYPSCVTDALEGRLATLLGTGLTTPYTTIDRPVRHTDPHQTVAIHSAEWVPGPVDEIGGTSEPTLNQYLTTIQLFLKMADRGEGKKRIAQDSKMLRAILYRDPTLAVAFAAMSEDLLGSRERFQRRGVRSSKYMNNEIRGSFVFLSTTVFWVETETMIL